MIKKCQIEERLAVAIHNYVRSCREVRTADTLDEAEAARLLKAERRKILGGIESTFHKLGGDAGELQSRIDAILIPGGGRPEVSTAKASEFLERPGHLQPPTTSTLTAPNMTLPADSVMVPPEVDECDL